MEAWQRSALDEYAETSLSMANLAKKYGRSHSTIAKLVAKYGVKKSKGVIKQRGIRPPLSIQHRYVGIRLSLFRGLKQYSEVSEIINVSRVTYRTMELGVHDFTLNELQRISEALGVPIPTLMAPLEKK